MPYPMTKNAPRSLVDELREKLDEKRAECKAAWDTFEAKRTELVESDVDVTKAGPEIDKLNELEVSYRALADEVDELQESWAKAVSIYGSGVKAGGENGHGRRKTSAHGNRLSHGAAFMKALGIGSDGDGMKAALGSTTSGAIVPPWFSPDIVELPQAALFVRSLIPVTVVDSAVVQYVRQSAYANSAAPVAEHGVKPTTTMTIERVETPVTAIAHVTEAISRELVSDYDALVLFIDTQLRLGLLQTEETQILSGSGTPPNLRGILNTAGINTVTAVASESYADVIYRGIQAIRSDFLEPDAVVVNPADWTTIRLSKDTTNQYITAGIVETDPDRLWGIRAIISPAVAPGLALVGAFGTACQLWDRERARVSFTESGASDVSGELFVKDEIRWRAEERLAFGVTIPGGFCSCDLVL